MLLELIVAPIVVSAAKALIDKWSDSGESSNLSLAPRGPEIERGATGVVGGPALSPTVTASFALEPEDDATAILLDESEPALMILATEGEILSMVIGSLGTRFYAQVPQGEYLLGFYVLDSGALAEEELIPIAQWEGEVRLYDHEDFVVRIALPDADFHLTLLMMQGLIQCEALTRKGYRCTNSVNDDYGIVCTSHGNAIFEGSAFLSAVTGEWIVATE